ncbi:MAG: hypothetical protein ACPL6D_14330 [Thermodesulfobacteriota bacterium]
MKTFFRWGLIVAGILVVAGVIYKVFFHVWPFYPPFYPMWGWRYHYFGPRIWPVFPFFGMLILIVAGILIAGYFFKALRGSSVSKKDGAIFCPYCGREIKREKVIPEVQAEKV